MTERVAYDFMGRIAEKTVSKGSGENDSFTVYTTFWTSGKIKKEEIKDSEENILRRTEYAYEESFQDTGDYDQNCQVLTVTQLVSGNGNGTADQTRRLKRYVDPLGRVHKEESYLNQTAYKTTYEYDLRGNVSSFTSPRDNADSSFTGKSMQYEYDCAGRQIQARDAANRLSFVSYDGLGRTVYERDFDQTETLYEYDDFGNVASQKTPLEKDYPQDELDYSPKYAETLNTYDTAGNLVTQKVKSNPVDEEPYVGSPRSVYQPSYRVTNMGYDDRRRLDYVEVEETDGSKTYTKYFYDQKGNIETVATGLTSPDVTSDVIPASAHVTRYTYDPYLNSMNEVTQPDGTTQYYDYNYFNLVDSQGYRKNGETYGTVNYQYSALGDILSTQAVDDMKSVQYAYDKLGEVTQIVDDSGTRNFEYDSLGRLTKETNGTTVKQYGYDENNNRTWFYLTQGETQVQQQQYVYNRLNQLTQVQDGTGAILAAYTYDSYGRLTGENKGGSVSTEYTYNAGGQLKSKTNKKIDGGEVIDAYSYSYYFDGNILSENNRTFAYDPQGRLTQEQNGTDTISYTYDRFGNRATMTNNGNLTSYTYDLNNRLLQEVSGDEYTFYNYDNKGNLYSKRTDERSTAGNLTRVDTFGALKDHVNSTVELYSYNGFNRLQEVRKGGTTVSYVYNAEGIRTSKTVNGVTTDFLLDGSNVVAETKNGSTTNYIRGLTGIISSSIQGTNNTTKYYTSDGHGNITKLTDSTGTVVKTYAYDAFGVEQNIDSNDTNPFRYCGEYYDSEIGQIYLRARYYNPAIGRFTQSDPAMSGTNWYVYGLNNPVMYLDPLGLEEIVVSGGAYSDPSVSGHEGDFKYNFIEPAIKKLKELIENNKNGELITWLIADAGWSDNDKEKFQEVANNLGVRLAFFSSKNSFFSYINNKYSGESRANDRITRFIVFSHGFADGTLALGYNYGSNYNKSLNISISDVNTRNIKTFDAFDNPNSAFYSCNTGTGAGGSFAQAWVNITGGTTWAFAGRTNYGNMNKGEGLENKMSRRWHGFSYYGSHNYPEADEGAYLVTFRKWWS